MPCAPNMPPPPAGLTVGGPSTPPRLGRGAAAAHQDPVGVENADVVDPRARRGGAAGRRYNRCPPLNNSTSSAAVLVLRRTDESYEGAVSPPRRLFVGAAEKRPQTSSARLMLPGGPCTQSDEDLNHLMTIGSDRRCLRPKRSSPRDGAAAARALSARIKAQNGKER